MQLIADDEEYTTRERVAQICAMLALRGWPQPHLFNTLYVNASDELQREYWEMFKTYAMGRLGVDAS